MTQPRAQYIERRLQLLELEAELQRATLAATIAQWEQKRLLNWASGAGRIALRALSSPRIRWLLLAALWRRWFRRGR